MRGVQSNSCVRNAGSLFSILIARAHSGFSLILAKAITPIAKSTAVSIVMAKILGMTSCNWEP
jgi:hypothetical protein